MIAGCLQRESQPAERNATLTFVFVFLSCRCLPTAVNLAHIILLCWVSLWPHGIF